jgi:hypothetical protein
VRKVEHDLPLEPESGKPVKYRSFLLRLWQTMSGGRLVWRASLEEARSGQRQGFADLQGLFEFLRRQTGSTASEQWRGETTDEGPQTMDNGRDVEVET